MNYSHNTSNGNYNNDWNFMSYSNTNDNNNTNVNEAPLQEPVAFEGNKKKFFR